MFYFSYGDQSCSMYTSYTMYTSEVWKYAMKEEKNHPPTLSPLQTHHTPEQSLLI